MTRRAGGERPAPVPPKRDDAGNPVPPAQPGQTQDAPATWGGEGGAGQYPGGPMPADPATGGGSEVM